MKRLFLLVVLLVASTTLVQGQVLSTNYLWADSIAVTTSSNDSSYSTQYDYWYSVTFWFDGCEGWVKVGAPDTSNWSDRNWLFLRQHEAMTIGPATKLRRIEFKADSGTGHLYMVGYKKKKQY